SRSQAAVGGASREAASARMLRTWPRATSATMPSNPARCPVPAPERPRSPSTTRIASGGQPSCRARCTRSYWRAVDSVLRSSWAKVDWRTYITAALERWELVILPDSLIARPRRHCGLGDQARQQRDRRFYLGAGELAAQFRRWRRSLVRPQ